MPTESAARERPERCPSCGFPIERAFINGLGKRVYVPIRCQCAKTEQRRRECFLFDSQAAQTFAADDGKFGTEITEKCRSYAEKFTLEHSGLLLFGPPDSGKTFLACAIANKALSRGFKVLVRSMPWVLSLGYDATAGAIQDLARADVLVLDDLGAERATDYGREVVYSVIDGRYQAKRPAIITTNLTRQELAQPADIRDKRTYSRILEMCYPLEVDTGRRRSTRERYKAMEESFGW